jgi:4-oxalocrotonate tautomerase
MPHIQVTMLKGRSTEQKRKLAKRLTDAMVEEAGAVRDGVTVVMVEVEKEDFARGGTLIADRK